MGFFNYCRRAKVFERNLSAVFIALFPKKGGAFELKDLMYIKLGDVWL